MKASRLIERLNELIDVHGDRDIVISIAKKHTMKNYFNYIDVTSRVLGVAFVDSRVYDGDTILDGIIEIGG